jgi:hypothetical protein
MSALLRRPSTYLALPMLLACAATLLTFDLPSGYLDGVLLLAACAVGVWLLDALVGPRLPPFECFRARDYTGTREAMAALAFCALVGVFCLLDLTLFPIPLLDNPQAYAQMEGAREHVRHVSAWCWVFPPVGLLCVRNRAVRYGLIAAGIVFPVLVIDRNRIFASLFSLALVIVLRRDARRPLPWKTVGLLGLAGAVLFAVLGIIRSGTLDTVTLPFQGWYREAPPGLKWLLLYVSAGPYNFASILAKHYENVDFLLNQVIPGRGSIVTAGTGIPLDAPNINVGTEFFPFLMALGPLGAIASFAALYGLLAWSARLLRGRISLFALLIFLRMSYVAVMAPFAPQAFTFMTAGFLVLCLAMQLFAAWLPDRRTMPPPAVFPDATTSR